jgi:hypothetical protein
MSLLGLNIGDKAGNEEVTKLSTPTTGEKEVAPSPLATASRQGQESVIPAKEAPKAPAVVASTANVVDTKPADNTAKLSKGSVTPETINKAANLPCNWKIERNGDKLVCTNLVSAEVFHGTTAEFSTLLRS